MEDVRLSAVVLTRNEAAVIERCLRGLLWADEIVVVDSGSTDRTVEICGAMPEVRVVQRPFDGFAAQRNAARPSSRDQSTLRADAITWLSVLRMTPANQSRPTRCPQGMSESGARGRSQEWVLVTRDDAVEGDHAALSKQAARVHDDDLAPARLGNHLLAQERAAASLEERERLELDLVGAVDCHVDDRMRLQRRERDSEPPRQTTARMPYLR